MIGGVSVVFKSKYLRTVALISEEVEYMALIMCTQGVLWICALLKDLGLENVVETYSGKITRVQLTY